MQTVHKVLTSTLRHQQPVNSAAWNNHTLIPLTVLLLTEITLQ